MMQPGHFKFHDSLLRHNYELLLMTKNLSTGTNTISIQKADAASPLSESRAAMSPLQVVSDDDVGRSYAIQGLVPNQTQKY